MLKTIIATFITVFIAELGDKTQLSTMMLASKSHSIWPVFIGSATALVASSLIGVFAGSVVNRYIPMNYIHTGAGIIFIVMGFLFILNKI